ncbi:MAG: peptide MFS transporter [Flavobacteriales bacterium]|jgi:POT family proton-dependent oligopeptide transporter|uniref:peptide MFS transporter n=1 Tax=Candidatus Ulvibacter alkanivorans TaxID=2267620 RepID=UPI000DF1CFEC|nr:peptide MFS transporter [Candidatus Ulvibacter alkanivorans]MCH2489301.1 peptide MFS transporter [Flavobacteriales bacterium]
MEFKFGGSETNQKTVLGHPSGLFVLFFTEMWERFSYYGMRALLVLFLVSAIFDEGGWGWERADALVLYAWYTGLVYVTPIFGGLIADKIMGYRRAVVLGALLMTLGHASMALEVISDPFFYLGLGLLIVGNGLFKPNISSMVGQLYKTQGKEKDAGYTIFYMGINAGAFLGILLCGYIGEKVGWHYGFGLAGIFMFFGMLQFYFAQKIFGRIGLSPKGTKDFDAIEDSVEEAQEAIEDTMDEAKRSKVTRDRLIVIGVLAFFTIFFWWAFEQAGGSMTIFAKDYTDRVLVDNGALIFKIFNTLLTVVPMLIITWVLGLLFKQTFAKYSLSNILLGTSFVIIWGIVIWMLARQFADPTPEVPASWFGILNSFFIIAFAPLFSKLWESKYNPTGPVKFAIGLILLGLGFGILAYGSLGIPLGAKTASVSMIFLILAYLFHTLGELCVSPVGLSYVSKLAPIKLVGLMFGVWFVSNFIANLAAGFTGSYIDPIVEEYGMTTFFLIFTLVPVTAGIVMLILNRTLLRMMHGIR